jgi:tetratricopeptide (TPR) repeat protein
LELSTQLYDRVRGRALYAAGALAYGRSQYEKAERLYGTALSIQRDAGDENATATTLNALGALACDTSQYRHATEVLDEAVVIRRRIGDRFGLRASLNNLANVARYSGDLARAAALYESTVDGAEPPVRRPRWRILSAIWPWYCSIKDGMDEARARAEESLRIARSARAQVCIAQALSGARWH